MLALIGRHRLACERRAAERAEARGHGRERAKVIVDRMVWHEASVARLAAPLALALLELDQRHDAFELAAHDRMLIATERA